MIPVKGYAAQTAQANLEPWNYQVREVRPHDIQIRVMYCGVCHTDLHQIRNDWYPGIFPMVPGHEIIGEVIQIGDHVKKFKVGDRAGVGTMVDSCGACSDCETGHENTCTEGAVWTYNSMGKDGLPTYGGYANIMVVSEHYALQVDKCLDAKGVGPLLCAGITTYSPLRKFKVGARHHLAVLGLGGLGHMAVKFGVAFGAEVTVLSNSAAKYQSALDLGAHHFVDTSDAAQMANAKGSFDFIVDCVSAKHDLNMYLTLLKTNGVHICVGIPAEPYVISPFSLLSGNKSVAGTGSGGIQETQEMLDFCAAHQITADVELIAIADIHQAFDRMVRGDVRYRFVIDLNTL